MSAPGQQPIEDDPVPGLRCVAAWEAALSPRGHLYLVESDSVASALASSFTDAIWTAFSADTGTALSYLGGVLIDTALSPTLGYWRDFGKKFFTGLCAHSDITPGDFVRLEMSDEELAKIVAVAPPMTGGEILNTDILRRFWRELEETVTREYSSCQNLPDYLHGKHSAWNAVGRVCLHLAENRQNQGRPFAFMASYAAHLSSTARAQHRPLGQALEEYAGNRKALLNLLVPVQKACEHSVFLKKLTDDGKIYHPLALTPAEAFAFLKDIPLLEESGLVVRVPDWWAVKRPARPQVSVTIGGKEPSLLGAHALMDFSMEVSLNGETLTQKELNDLLQMPGGLVSFKGKWIELDPDKLKEAIKHWSEARKLVSGGMISFPQAMRLLAGMPGTGVTAEDTSPEAVSEWSKVNAGEWLNRMLRDLRQTENKTSLNMAGWLTADLRPYQQKGIEWLWLLHHLGLGGCLADDMGLGKTIQVLGLLAGLKKKTTIAGNPHLIVVPASLIANWKAEFARFAPDLKILAAHPSEMPPADLANLNATALKNTDVVLITYGGLARMEWAKAVAWNVTVLDEAQAIKNPAAKQTHAVKALNAATRIALTGTPIENRLSDLWSIFDFVCPGLLGSAKAFSGYAKKLAGATDVASYGPLRTLVSPYILRRLKTDKRVIKDLPEKTELKAYCPLSKTQAVLYEKSVASLAKDLKELEESDDKMKRRGIILAYLMRFKQICNHPSQWLGDAGYQADLSGKFLRLAEICEPIAARQEKALVFTQFREMTEPLHDYLTGVFIRPGLVLHGQTPVAKRQGMVKSFQEERGPPFFILSLKAGGTGLNLTAASHVIHFDRWWNPAVENQATDRAFRIGQKNNVLVHKFICQGTVEERIDALIESKKALSTNILGGDATPLLTEMSDKEILDVVKLDFNRALGEG